MIKKFYRLIAGCRPAIFAVWLAFVIMGTLRAFMNTYVYKFLFDDAIAAKNMHIFIITVSAYATFHIVDYFFKTTYPIVLKRQKNKITKNFMAKALNVFYSLPYLDVKKENNAYFTGRIYDETNKTADETIDMFAINFASTPVYFLISVGIAFHISWQISVFAGTVIPLLILFTKKYASKIKKTSIKEQEAESQMLGITSKAAKAYRTVRIFAMQNTALNHIRNGYENLKNAILLRETNIQKQETYSSISMEINELLILFLCGYFMMKGKMTAGEFMAYTSAFWGAVDTAKSLVSAAAKCPKISAQMERIFSFLGLAEETKIQAGGSSAKGLDFEDVSFSFGEKQILDGLTFNVKPGESLLLEGRNGTGKSTIANIACGFLQPQKGKAALPPLGDISACISPHVFIPGTLADNINYANLPPETKKYADSLLEKFGLADKLNSSPEEFSAGQKKKAEIITGLLKQASLYIFDEPLANVDEAGKAGIMEEISARTKNAALLAIIHGDEQYYGMFSKRTNLGTK